MFGTETMVPVAFMIMLAYTLVGITKIISDGRTRRRLIEKAAAPELARALGADAQDDPGLHGALRWGLVTGAAGLALILIQFLPFRSDDPIMLGVILVFVAAGLLTYYATARRMGRPTARGGAA